MARFITHGTIIGEPVRKVLTSGTEVVELELEEVTKTNKKDIVRRYSITFIGKSADYVPYDHNVNGEVAIITGTVKSRDYNGKRYYDLDGSTFTLVSAKALNDKVSPLDVEVTQPVKSTAEEPAGEVIDNDDLPF